MDAFIIVIGAGLGYALGRWQEKRHSRKIIGEILMRDPANISKTGKGLVVRPFFPPAK